VEDRRRGDEIESTRDQALARGRGRFRRAARPQQGLGSSHRQASRQLRRGVRPQRRRRLQARHQPRAQPAVDQRRHPVRAADPVIERAAMPPAVALYSNPTIRAALYQLALFGALLWFGYEFAVNARSNLTAQNITSGFGFLDHTAGFGVNQSLIAYS